MIAANVIAKKLKAAQHHRNQSILLAPPRVKDRSTKAEPTQPAATYRKINGGQKNV
jgi:hypothetical protein